MSHLSNKITELRKNARYTQTLIASKLDIPQKRYAAYEEGRANPPVEIMITIADFHGISLDELLRPVKTEGETLPTIEH